jgi:hypothetical protein
LGETWYASFEIKKGIAYSRIVGNQLYAAQRRQDFSVGKIILARERLSSTQLPADAENARIKINDLGRAAEAGVRVHDTENVAADHHLKLANKKFYKNRF